jgi:phosphate transport system substrate-binding protein
MILRPTAATFGDTVMHTVRRAALLLLLVWLACVGISCKRGGMGQVAPPGGTTIRGAGATFPAPLYNKWIAEYTRLHTDVMIHYAAVGSGEGIRRFVDGAVDFGASDSAMKEAEREAVKRGVQLVPMTAGSVVLAYNLPGVEGELKLSRDVYVDIFLGEITQWSDPRITKLNPDLDLPDMAIAVGARLDSSGTTFAFTNHLSSISNKWAEGPGVAKYIDWPGPTMLANGNEGVAGLIRRTPGAIGYVEYGTAERAGLSMAALENKAGKFLLPSGESGMATLRNAQLPEDLVAFFPDPDGEDSYPVVTYTWLLLYQQYEDPDVARELKEFVTWCLDEGQEYSEQLGYVRLAPPVAEQALAAVGSL